MRRRGFLVYCTIVVIVLVALAAAIVWRMAAGPREHAFAEPELSSAAMRDYVPTSVGWTPREGALWLPSDTRGVRTYKFPTHPAFTPLVTLRFDKPEGGFNVVHISYPDQRGEDESKKVQRQWNDENLAWARRDVSDAVRGPGFFFLTLDAQRPAGVTGAAPLVHEFAVTLQPQPRGIHWGAAAFFLVLTVIGYAGLLLVVVPAAGAALGAARQAAAALKRPYGVIVWAALALGALAVLARPDKDSTIAEWWLGKKFDDRAALGAAALLFDNGADVTELYFRSRIRPGLTAWLSPWAVLLPHRLASATFAPSDNKERMFYFYDRAGAGGRVYWEMSIFFAAAALTALLSVGGLAARLSARPWIAAAASVFAAVFFARCLYNCISISANLIVTMAAAGAGAVGWLRGGRAMALAAGIFLGLAAATTETTIILMSALFLFQLWTWRETPSRPGPPRILQFALFWLAAAAPCLIYYGLILDTGFAELPRNHALVKLNMANHEYEPLNLRSGLAAYWGAFGLGLPLAVVGVGWTVARRPWTLADRLFLAWFAATLWTLTMPFLFVRFLVFSIPPFACMAARGLECLGAGIARMRRRGIERTRYG